MFDKIVIAIGVNEAKRSFFTIEERLEMVKSVFEGNDKVCVKSYDTLTVDFAMNHNAKYILRGIRSVGDFEYEKTIADVNRELSGVETVVFFTEPKYTHISSTIVRELITFKKDVSAFVPQRIDINKFIEMHLKRTT